MSSGTGMRRLPELSVASMYASTVKVKTTMPSPCSSLLPRLILSYSPEFPEPRPGHD